MNDTDRLQRLADRMEIQDLMARYSRCVDRAQWAGLREIYHPDAVDDHGAYVGDVEGFIAWVSRRHAAITEAMHFLGNCLVDFAGPDTALVETYFTAYMRISGEAVAANAMFMQAGAGAGESHDVVIRGRYVDRVERRAGVWRIAKRVTVFESIDSRPANGPRPNPDHRWASRSRDDTVFRMRDEIFGAGVEPERMI
ncbi:MAG: nuclear transport factor 2 family protein [Rubrivivax sp.]